MEELQRLSGCTNELVLDIPSLDFENLHIDGFESPTTLIEDELNNNSIGDAESLNLDWLNELISFGDHNKLFGSTAIGDDEIVSPGELITSDRKDVAAGLNISQSINNWSVGALNKLRESTTDFTESRAAYKNIGPVEVSDSNFHIPKFLDLESTTSPKKRKLTDKSFKRSNEIDGLVEAFDGTDEDDVKCTTRNNRCLESAHFEMKKYEVRCPVAEVGPNSAINTEKYFSNDELMALSAKELNRRVRSLPKAVVDEIKRRRRTLKNRGYARSCRDKKNCETNNLKEVKEDLEKELATKMLQLAIVRRERDDWKQKCLKLAQTVEKLGIKVRL